MALFEKECSNGQSTGGISCRCGAVLGFGTLLLACIGAAVMAALVAYAAVVFRRQWPVALMGAVPFAALALCTLSGFARCAFLVGGRISWALCGDTVTLCSGVHVFGRQWHFGRIEVREVRVRRPTGMLDGAVIIVLANDRRLCVARMFPEWQQQQVATELRSWLDLPEPRGHFSAPQTEVQ